LLLVEALAVDLQLVLYLVVVVELVVIKLIQPL
jgi:hypothetical protein